MKHVDYTFYTYFMIFRLLKRVGSVLSSSELDPFFIYANIQFGPKADLAPVTQISSYNTTH